MRKILLTIFSSAFILIGPIIACPLDEEDKNKKLSELCTMDDRNYSSYRLNEMIIFLKFDKLPPEENIKDNRILAALTCDPYRV